MWFCKKKSEKKVAKIPEGDRFNKTCYMEKTVRSYDAYSSEDTTYKTYDQVEYSGQVVKLPDAILYEIREPVKRDYIRISLHFDYERQYNIVWVDSLKLHFPILEEDLRY